MKIAWKLPSLMLFKKLLPAMADVRAVMSPRLLLILVLIVGTISAVFLSRSLGREDSQASALAEGRRVEISLITGEIEGDPLAIVPVIKKNIQAEVHKNSSVVGEEKISALEKTSSVSADEISPENNSAGEAVLETQQADEIAAEAQTQAATAEAATNSESTTGENSAVENINTENVAAAEDLQKKSQPDLSVGENQQPEPVAALETTEQKEYGGRDLYARVPSFERPLIAILLTGLGLSTSSTEQALQLPKNITLGFSPYSTSLEDWLERADNGGYEVSLHVPMQTANMRQSDPGPFSLLVNSGEEQNIQRMKTLLGLAAIAKSVYSDYDETLSLTMSSISPLLRVLRDKNIPFVYGAGHANQVLLQRSIETGQALVVNDMILDNQIDSDAIAKQLLDLEEIAVRKGYAVAMARPYPVTCQLLARWEATLPKKRIQLVKVSELGNALQKVLQGDVQSPPAQ